MKQIKDYFKSWEIARIIRGVLGILLLTAFYFDRQQLFLFIGIMLSVQAAFNMSCPGGGCSLTVDKNVKQVVDVKKYELQK
jgi:hypothetical protein